MKHGSRSAAHEVSRQSRRSLLAEALAQSLDRGAVVGVAVDARDRVWIAHRPSTLQPNETRSVWQAAPPVLAVDATSACILRRETLDVMAGFGRAGHSAGQFYGAHRVAANRAGDLFIGETYEGKRVQRFVRTAVT